MAARLLATLGSITAVTCACALLWSASASAEAVPVPPGVSAGAAHPLYAVSCPLAGDCVAGGYYEDASGDGHDLVVTEAAGAWTATGAPAPSGAATDPGAYIQTMDCTSAGSCEALGWYVDSSGDVQVAALAGVDGTWSASKVPLPGGFETTNPFDLLTSIWCASAGNCAAVGAYAGDAAASSQGLVLTETNGAWSAGNAPLPTGAESPDPAAGLESMSCVSAGNCTAVGEYKDSSGNGQGLLLTETDGAWSAREAPLPIGARSNPSVLLQAVSCAAAGDCVAVGQYTDGDGDYQGLVLTEANGAWSASEAPLPSDASTDPENPDVYLKALSCLSAGNCVAVGSYYNTTGYQQALVLTETDGAWSASEAPLPSGAANDPADPDLNSLGSVLCRSSAGCLAVGVYGDGAGYQQGMVLSETNGAWTATEAPLPSVPGINPDVSLPSLSCAADGYCAVAGMYDTATASYQGLLLTAPDAPAGVAAVAGTDQASVSWQAPADDGGFPVTGYTVTATDLTDAARGGQTATTGASTLSATLTGLTPGDSYTFTVAAGSMLGTGVGATSSAVTVTATKAQLEATLSKILAPSGKNAKLKAILKHGGYTFRYPAVESGRLVVDWYYVTTREKGRKHHRHRVKVRTLVAKASVKLSKPGALNVKVKLTKAGRKLLKAHRKLKLTAEVSFTPTGGKPVKKAKTFTLK